jgi:RNA polymerase subunit RPABC4/transcription elongation factor Spt4
MKERGYHLCPRCNIETLDNEFCPDCEQEIAAKETAGALNQTKHENAGTKVIEIMDTLPRTA